ncbi:MAG: deoxyuridine 5'-triphosphate nucleotidohydrolase [bacterium]|nr:MAG: deoxyuridine 5'-triphosphate nucleotidohydrolase [bacterium]
MNNVKVKLQKLSDQFTMPYYASEGSSGLDLFACISMEVEISPMSRVLIPTGFAMSLSEGYEAQIRPRSGLAWNHGITVLNSPGTIDRDYRGEVKVMLINLGSEKYVVKPKSRIAQMVIAEVCPAKITIVPLLEPSERGEGGFGSTGIT